MSNEENYNTMKRSEDGLGITQLYFIFLLIGGGLEDIDKVKENLMDRKRKINGKKFTFIYFHALNIILREEQ